MPDSNKLVLVTIAAVLALAASISFAQPDAAQPAETSEGLVEVSKTPADGASPQAAPSDGAAAAESTTQPGPQGPPMSLWDKLRQNSFLFVMIGGFILLYLWMGRGRRKKEAKRRDMLASLKKGDKVTSIGGIVGTVMEVREDEVSVKVDENNNIRMKFARWAIRGVGEEAKTETPEGNR